MDAIVGDPLFKVIEHLDHDEIFGNLCTSSEKTAAWCQRRRSEIYGYLLRRDFGLDEPNPRIRYIRILRQFDDIVQALQNQAPMFGNLLRNEFRRNPMQSYRLLNRGVIIAPSDYALSAFVEHGRFGNIRNFMAQYGNDFLMTHLGFRGQPPNVFVALNNSTFMFGQGDEVDTIDEISILAEQQVGLVEIKIAEGVLMTREQAARWIPR
jgi:hypothetical protein